MIKYITFFVTTVITYTPVYIYHAFIVNRGNVVNYKCKKKDKEQRKKCINNKSTQFFC